MVNAGLRAYLWQLKSPEQQAARSGWKLHENSYAALRDYTTAAKATGFPGQDQAQILSTAPPEDAPKSGLDFTGGLPDHTRCHRA